MGSRVLGRPFQPPLDGHERLIKTPLTLLNLGQSFKGPDGTRKIYQVILEIVRSIPVGTGVDISEHVLEIGEVIGAFLGIVSCRNGKTVLSGGEDLDEEAGG